jgi:hypothetical protein
MEFLQQMQSIQSVQGVSDRVVFDSCPELVKKIKAFLLQDGVTKCGFCDALGFQGTQLNKFLAAKKQDAAGTTVYRNAYKFFEQKRILDNAKKSTQRVKNEQEHSNGFMLEKPRTQKWFIVPRR